MLAWSLDMLATGRYPFFDPSRQTWQDAGDKRREALFGEYLSPYRHKGIYVQSTGDWTYPNEIYHWPWHQSAEHVCRKCFAKMGQGHLNYANAQANAPWTDPSNRRTDQEYFEAVLALLGFVPPLCRVIGWTQDTVLDDVVHDDLLGVRLDLVGSALKEMSDHHFWAAGIAGPWKERLKHQLGHAFRKFKTFCRAKSLKHSGGRRKAHSLSMTSLSCWPELKRKAHNCAVLSLWLAEELRVGFPNRPDLPPRFGALAKTMWGFAAMYHVYSGGGQRLSDSEVTLLEGARSAGLEGYHLLSLYASTCGTWLCKLQPQFHKLDESVRLACRSHRNPAWW